MRYSLRTLMIVMLLGGPALAGLCRAPEVIPLLVLLGALSVAICAIPVRDSAWLYDRKKLVVTGLVAVWLLVILPWAIATGIIGP